ncbi:lipocalin-like domain-containing protein [Rhizobium sp. BK251]|uniref:lipocalin-like domain-containing protein n=1 Tax=Rhizobium sp. BK251 TaxID=2512125 RepID=UPI00104C7D18|nr:lipocalin-like domain-containing protein [Rhizobium sp. BK251]TCL74568.1 lipocalin-like protein [Rhizobium sp. BK251]
MTDAKTLLGTWKMISWTRTVVSTGEVSNAMGADPIGYIAYHADGRMMAFVANRQRPKSNGTALSTQQKADLFDTMLAYAATYTLEDGRLIHHVEAAWNPAWQIDLIRPFAFNGETLVISDAPGNDPVTGEEVIYRLEFRKL